MKVRYGFRGECEEVFPVFCKKILDGESPSGLPGLVVNDGGKIRAAEPATVATLDSLADPAYDLLDMNRYYSPSTDARVMSVILSRGCPYNCIFCCKLNKTHYRSFSTERMLSHVGVLLRDHAVRWIEFLPCGKARYSQGLEEAQW